MQISQQQKILKWNWAFKTHLEPEIQQTQIHSRVGYHQANSIMQGRINKMSPMPRRKVAYPKESREKHFEQMVWTNQQMLTYNQTLPLNFCYLYICEWLNLIFQLPDDCLSVWNSEWWQQHFVFCIYIYVYTYLYTYTYLHIYISTGGVKKKVSIIKNIVNLV